MGDAQIRDLFVESAVFVLESEIAAEVECRVGATRTATSATGEITVVLGVMGDLSGSVFFSLSKPTATAITGAVLGSPLTAYDDMVGSAMAELGNVVVGRAGMALEEIGRQCQVSPPTLLVGTGADLRTPELELSIVTLATPHGALEMGIALQESPKANKGESDRTHANTRRTGKTRHATQKPRRPRR